MSKASQFIVSAVLIAIVLAACTGNAAVLEGKTWVLASYGMPDDPQAVLKDTRITIEFGSTEGRVSGTSGCNSYFAQYSITHNELSITEINYSKALCRGPEGVMEQEGQYRSTLASAERYRIRDGQLHILCSRGQVLVFSVEE